MTFQHNSSLRLGFLLSVVLSTPVYAQSDSTDVLKLRLGGSVGINIANQASRSPLGDSRIGLIVSSVAELTVGELCIQIEPRYIQKGMKWTYVITGSTGPTQTGTAQTVLKLDYIEIPILWKWHPVTEAALSPFIFVGGSVGVLLSAKEEVEDAALLQAGKPPTTDLKSFYEPFDFTLDVGAGLEYRLSPDVSLFAGGRYSYGVYDVRGSVTSRGIQILIGALFDL